MASLDLRLRDLEELPSIPEENITKLNASNNRISNISSLPSSLTFCHLGGNLLTRLPTLPNRLSVLNLSHNQFTRLPSHLPSSLKALIVSNNALQSLSASLSGLDQLNTLAVSHNQLSKLSHLGTLKELKKLSASHNALSTFPSFLASSDLRELRLNANKICTIPDSIARVPRLEILDLGNNDLKEFTDLIHLMSCPRLRQLNLAGNPVAQKEGYREKMRVMLPSLRSLDGKPFERVNKKVGKNTDKMDIEVEEKETLEQAQEQDALLQDTLKEETRAVKRLREKDQTAGTEDLQGQDSTAIKKKSKKTEKMPSPPQKVPSGVAQVIQVGSFPKQDKDALEHLFHESEAALPSLGWDE